MNYRLTRGDCLEVMKSYTDGSVDLILTDPPYGCTPAFWDSPVDMKMFFEQSWRVLKKNGPIVLFADMRRAAQWINLSPREYRYDIVWDKKTVSGFLNSSRCPLRKHELILIFSRKQPTYNPQKIQGEPYKRPTNKLSSCYGKYDPQARKCPDGQRYPTSIVSYSIARHRPHPTQKPVELCEYLIKTYTNEGELVLDPFAGSGSTGVACVNTNRQFLGIELDEKFFAVAKNRIEVNR